MRLWKYSFLVASLVCLPLSAQNTPQTIDSTAITPTAGAGHDYIQSLAETVNPGNGSLSIRIAAPVPIERGLNQPLNAFIYDTNGQYQWQPEISPVNGALTEIVPLQPTGPSGGSPITSTPNNIGSGFYGGPGTVSHTNVSLESGVSHTCAYSTDYIYTDVNGGRHPLNIYYITPPYENANACGYFGGWQSGYTTGGDETVTAVLDPNSTGDVFVYDRHGNQLNPDYKIEDTNGNYLNGTGRLYSGTYGGNNSISPASLTIPGLGNAYQYSYGTPSSQAPSSPFSPNAVLIQGNYNNETCPTGFTAPTISSLGNTTITLPNLQAYTLSYDPNYNLINKITYPTGATATYTWENNQQSVVLSVPTIAECLYHYDTPAVKTRIVSYDGTHPALEQDFSYTTTWGSPLQWSTKTTTVITKDLIRSGTPTSTTIYTYTPIAPNFVLGVNPFQGSGVPVESSIVTKDSSGNVLQTITKTWLSQNLMSGQCTTSSNGQTSGTFYQYAPQNGLIADKAEYDYGLVSSSCAQPSTTPTRETLTTYQLFSETPIHTLILDRPYTVTVKDHGTVISQTTYAYDQYAVAPVSGALAHDEIAYGPSSSAPRGNLTSVTLSCLQNCVSSTTTYTYDETGQVVTRTDAKGNVTSYSYADKYSTTFGSPTGNTNTYLTTVTTPSTNGVSHIDQYQYGFSNGKVTSHIDQNGNPTGYCYQVFGCTGAADPWARLTQVNNPDGGVSTTFYSDAGPQPTTTISTALSSLSSITGETIFDAYGHVLHTLQTSDPGGNDIVDSTYDGLGLTYTVTNPYRGTPTATTTYTYDALGRMTNQQNPDLTSKSWTYNSNVTTSKDENGNFSSRTYDAFGRLTNVSEPNGAPTSYVYDALNNLKTVTQSGLSGDTPRTRSFTYDSLSRLLTAQNPETGTICYGQWSGSNCVNGYDANGNVVAKTDARGIVTNYVYDALNRPLSKSYTNDPGGTVSSCYQYDLSSVPNAAGRLTAQWTQSASAGVCSLSNTPWTKRTILQYDTMGRVLSEQQYTPATVASGKPYTPAYTYDLAGNLITSTDGVTPTPTTPGTTLTFTSCIDRANHLQTLSSNWIDSTHPQSLFSAQGSGSTPCVNTSSPTLTSPTYAAFGGLTSAILGKGLTITRGYDNNTLRITSETATGGATSAATTGSTTITVSGAEQSQ